MHEMVSFFSFFKQNCKGKFTHSRKIKKKISQKHLCHHSDVYPFQNHRFPFSFHFFCENVLQFLASFIILSSQTGKFLSLFENDENCWHWWEWIVQIIDEIMHQICRNFIFRIEGGKTGATFKFFSSQNKATIFVTA